jgi:hypothetical protein
MPRSMRSKRVTASAQTDVGVTTVPTLAKTDDDEQDTVRELPFTVEITPAEEGFKPDRSPAGRKRIPSPFEPILPELKGKGWQNQPHDGNVVPERVGEDGTAKYNTTSSVRDSNARVILRELSKAVKWLNSGEGGKLNLGLDVNVTDSLVQFNIRDKQNRKPRNAPGGGDVSDGEQNDDDDNGDDE